MRTGIKRSEPGGVSLPRQDWLSPTGIASVVRLLYFEGMLLSFDARHHRGHRLLPLPRVAGR